MPTIAVALAGCLLVLSTGTSQAAEKPGPLAAPRLGAYAPQSANKILRNDARGRKQIARLAAWNHHSAEAVSQAYGGAPAIVESYASQDLNAMFSLIAVRASTPGLFALYSDAKFLQVVRPYQEVLKFGAASCLVLNDATPAGKKPAADSVQTVECMRSGPHLTVMIMNVSEPLGNRPSAAAAVVDQAWQALSSA